MKQFKVKKNGKTVTVKANSLKDAIDIISVMPELQPAGVNFDYLLSEERKAVEDYRNAIASTNDSKLIYVLSHILKEETHHIELLEAARQDKVEFADSNVVDNFQTKAREVNSYLKSQGFTTDDYSIFDRPGHVIVEPLDETFDEIKQALSERYQLSNEWSGGHRLSISFNDSKVNDEDTLGSELKKYQEWVDYDMKRYGKISEKTQKELDKAGVKVVKDKYGNYEVIE